VNFFPEKLSKNCTYDFPATSGAEISKKLKKIRKALDSSSKVPAPVFPNAPEFVPIISFHWFELILGAVPILVPLAEKKYQKTKAKKQKN
jgi:hypothetical protein